MCLLKSKAVFFFFFGSLLIFCFYIKFVLFVFLLRNSFPNLQSVIINKYVPCKYKLMNNFLNHLGLSYRYFISVCCKYFTVSLNFHSNPVRYGVFLPIHRKGKRLRDVIDNLEFEFRDVPGGVLYLKCEFLTTKLRYHVGFRVRFPTLKV